MRHLAKIFSFPVWLIACVIVAVSPNEFGWYSFLAYFGLIILELGTIPYLALCFMERKFYMMSIVGVVLTACVIIQSSFPSGVADAEHFWNFLRIARGLPESSLGGKCVVLHGDYMALLSYREENMCRSIIVSTAKDKQQNGASDTCDRRFPIILDDNQGDSIDARPLGQSYVSILSCHSN
jgi:hypothetical protein